MINKNPILSLNNVSVGYNKAIIKNINADFYPGEFISILGKNGVGKSTLLKTTCGLIDLLSGDILINNKSIKKINRIEKSKNIAFVSTYMPVLNLTVREMVSMGRLPYTGWAGKLNKTDNEIINKVLDDLNLNTLQNRKLYELSDGEKQRTLIGRAIVQDTPVIILDEPVAYLDVQNKYEILNLLKKLTLQGKTVLFSSHDVNIVLQLADNMIIIDNQSIYTGSPEDHILKKNINALTNNDNISFDLLKGGFYIKRKYTDHIGIMSDEPTFSILQNAFNRIGFNALCNKTSDINVKVMYSNDKYLFKLILKDDEITFGTIYDLIFYLKKLNN
ncbi:MAG: ABC transporter ATP-binding protein [Marinilabiliales bacterium]